MTAIILFIVIALSVFGALKIMQKFDNSDTGSMLAFLVATFVPAIAVILIFGAVLAVIGKY